VAPSTYHPRQPFPSPFSCLRLAKCHSAPNQIIFKGIMANQTFTKQSLTSETARAIISGAAAKAQEMGIPMSIAIVDEAGELKAFERMDGAAMLSVEIAQNKAWTSVSFGMCTHEWWDFIKGDPPLLHGIVHHPRLVIFGGGYSIKVDGELVGGIGVSGGHYSQDMEVAIAGLAAVGLEP